MDRQFADGLREALRKACPWATGQLYYSIQPAQPYGQNGWIITIGNGTVMGLGATKQVGKRKIKIIRKVPSNVYAAATNNSKTLRVFASGPRDDPKHPNFKTIDNPNYHWATNAIKQYVEANKGTLMVNIEEEQDEQI